MSKILAESANTNERILLGHVSGLFGVKGWVKVFSYTDPREQITHYKKWYLGGQADTVIELEQGQIHKQGVIAKLAGIDDRDTAATLVKKDIWVDKSDLPQLSENEYYWHDLIGCKVSDGADRVIGKVHDLIETGANDVLVVVTSNESHEIANNKQEHLIPYLLGQVIKSIDLDKQQIHVEWDLDY